MSNSEFDYFQEDFTSQITQDVQDQFDDPQPAFRCAVIGVGQCGNNLAAAFYNTGYRRVLAINTAKADLGSVKEPILKLSIGNGGAGKDPEIGRQAVEDHAPQIRSAMGKAFGDRYDKVIICMSLGGGTGSGGGPEVVRLVREVVRERGGNPDKDVMVIAVLPEPSVDGPRQCHNALTAYAKLERLNIPRLYVDNSQLRKVIRTTFGNNWPRLNDWIVKTFHKFNTFATRESEHGICDGRDLEDVLSRGRFIFSAFKVDRLEQKYSVGGIMAEHLQNSLFAKMNLKSADAAACLIILNQSAVQDKSMEDIAPTFTELNTLMKQNSTLHKGIYLVDLHPSPEGKLPPEMFCYVMLGGLEHPRDSLKTIFEKAMNHCQEYGSLSVFLNTLK